MSTLSNAKRRLVAQQIHSCFEIRFGRNHPLPEWLIALQPGAKADLFQRFLPRGPLYLHPSPKSARMATKRGLDEIISINVGGKRFTTKRSVLTADPKSRLAEWFKPNATKTVAQDKAGNYFVDRDGQAFRHILTYLRFRKEKFATSLAIPSRPDEIARVMGEADALQLSELRDMCAEMLSRYQKEDAGYAMAYVQCVARDFEGWSYMKSSSEDGKGAKEATDADGW